MFYICVLVAVAIGILVALSDWRIGVRTIAGALGAAALMRLVLPERDAGMLAVRHRLVDVGVLLAVGIALAVLAGTIPEQPA